MIPVHIRIRAFAPGDQAAVKRLVNDGLGERFGVVDESFNPDLDDIAAHYVAGGHAFVIAEREHDRALIGTGCLVFAPDGVTGQMVRVSVPKEMRGQGVGRAIVEHLLDVARERGLRRIWMETNLGWESAIRLYERCGFAEYTRRDGLVFLERRMDENQDENQDEN